jgi:hypothetical protein
VAAVAALVGTVLPVRAGAAAAPPPVTHQTVFATRGYAGLLGTTLWRLTLDPRGAAVARTPVASGDGGVAQDYAGGRLLFTRIAGTVDEGNDEIWVREASGASRFLTLGHRAIFTPGRTGVLVVRKLSIPDRDELWMYRSADSTTSQVFAMPPGRAVSDLRYSPDGRGVWLAVQEERYGYARYVQEYRFPEDRIVRTVRLRAAYGCPRFELLPSGTRALLACGTTAGQRLWVFHLPTGRVTAGYPVPGYAVHAMHGRLSDAELLFSVQTNAGWLGGWNLRTSTVRRLPGTKGYSEGVAAYWPYAHQP